MLRKLFGSKETNTTLNSNDKTEKNKPGIFSGRKVATQKELAKGVEKDMQIYNKIAEREQVIQKLEEKKGVYKENIAASQKKIEKNNEKNEKSKQNLEKIALAKQKILEMQMALKSKENK